MSSKVKNTVRQVEARNAEQFDLLIGDALEVLQEMTVVATFVMLRELRSLEN